METSNLPNEEFRTLVIRMLTELRGRVGELSENFNKDIRNKNEDRNYFFNELQMKDTLKALSDYIKQRIYQQFGRRWLQKTPN